MTHIEDRKLKSMITSIRSNVLLLGPRQVGKSTLERGLNPDLYINLANQDQFLTYSKRRHLMVEEIRASRVVKLLVVDEIQRVPAVMNSLQALIDEGPKDVRYIFTGSSARSTADGTFILPC